MAATGLSPCNGLAPIRHKTLCNTTLSRFLDARNPFLRLILCFMIILKFLHHKSNMAATGLSPCNGLAPISYKTLCNTTLSRFLDARNPFLRLILCFVIILKFLRHKFNMAATGLSPCNGVAPISHKTLCNTTLSRFLEARNPFLRLILCFRIILKFLHHKSNMTATGLSPCNGLAPTSHTTLCNTTSSRFLEARNLFLRLILCFRIILKFLHHKSNMAATGLSPCNGLAPTSHQTLCNTILSRFMEARNPFLRLILCFRIILKFLHHKYNMAATGLNPCNGL